MRGNKLIYLEKGLIPFTFIFLFLNLISAGNISEDKTVFNMPDVAHTTIPNGELFITNYNLNLISVRIANNSNATIVLLRQQNLSDLQYYTLKSSNITSGNATFNYNLTKNTIYAVQAWNNGLVFSRPEYVLNASANQTYPFNNSNVNYTSSLINNDVNNSATIDNIFSITTETLPDIVIPAQDFSFKDILLQMFGQGKDVPQWVTISLDAVIIFGLYMFFFRRTK